MTGFNRTNWDRKRMPENNAMAFDLAFMVYSSFRSIVCERQNEEGNRSLIIPPDAFYRHLRDSSLHNLFQKVKG
jgi:hypothetical protein